MISEKTNDVIVYVTHQTYCFNKNRAKDVERYTLTLENDVDILFVFIYSILELQNKRKLEELEEKWWISNEDRLECPKIEQESDGISIKNIGGVFLVIAIGSVLALFTLAFEFYWYKYRPEREQKDYAVPSSMSQATLSLSTSAVSLSGSTLKDIAESNIRMATDKL